MISPKLRNWIAGTVTFVWAANFAATLILPLHYKTDPSLHAVFMAIVGGAFALSREKKDKNDKDGDGEGRPS